MKKYFTILFLLFIKFPFNGCILIRMQILKEANQFLNNKNKNLEYKINKKKKFQIVLESKKN